MIFMIKRRVTKLMNVVKTSSQTQITNKIKTQLQLWC